MAVTSQICNREVLGSSLGPDAGYPGRGRRTTVPVVTVRLLIVRFDPR